MRFLCIGGRTLSLTLFSLIFSFKLLCSIPMREPSSRSTRISFSSSRVRCAMPSAVIVRNSEGSASSTSSKISLSMSILHSNSNALACTCVWLVDLERSHRGSAQIWNEASLNLKKAVQTSLLVQTEGCRQALRLHPSPGRLPNMKYIRPVSGPQQRSPPCWLLLTPLLSCPHSSLTPLLDIRVAVHPSAGYQSSSFTGTESAA